MKKRSIGKMFVLTIVTLGIYRLYWFIKTRKEMMSIADVDIPSPFLLLAPIMGYILAFVILIANSFNNTIDNEAASNVAPLLLFYVAFFGGFIFSALWLWKYSKAVEKVTHEKLSFALSLIVLLAVPDGVDILIIQDYFNKVDTSTTERKTPQPLQ